MELERPEIWSSVVSDVDPGGVVVLPGALFATVLKSGTMEYSW